MSTPGGGAEAVAPWAQLLRIRDLCGLPASNAEEMTMGRYVLAGYDGSEESEHALLWAVEEARLRRPWLRRSPWS
ncbi:hypothetical protein GCM10010191_88170 [Actinomadura vinacea]|uniref:Uncharacterized protein n=1 Tax=Actinomadura vinacea TaxID=115336 RepID=A0ABN3KC35_9ACTN